VLDSGTVSALFAIMRDFYVRKVTGGEEWNKYAINTFGKFVMTLLRAVVWAVLMLVFPFVFVLAINCKLFAFDTLAKRINDVTGAAAAGGDAMATITVTSVNLSLACELLLESFPQLFIMIKNNQMLGEGGGFAFYFSIVTSALAILNGVWPIGFWMKRKGSFMGGLDVELFDKWTCDVCGEEVGATTLKCKEDNCSGEHPELKTKGRRANPTTPRAAAAAAGLGGGAAGGGGRAAAARDVDAADAAAGSRFCRCLKTNNARSATRRRQHSGAGGAGCPYDVPAGWRAVQSRTRPGKWSYENRFTGERHQTLPTEPAHDPGASFTEEPEEPEGSGNVIVVYPEASAIV
jgi:hypothetical protein